MKAPKLVNVLIAKSILETIIVGTIALAVYLNAFPPTFKGWGEAVVETQQIHGWVINDARPWDRVKVQLFIDGRFWKQEVATHNRPDVFAAGWGDDPYHGYGFTTPKLPPGNHDARVYALHGSGEGARYTLQMVGNPIRFRVENDGSWTTATDVSD